MPTGITPGITLSKRQFIHNFPNTWKTVMNSYLHKTKKKITNSHKQLLQINNCKNPAKRLNIELRSFTLFLEFEFFFAPQHTQYSL